MKKTKNKQNPPPFWNLYEIDLLRVQSPFKRGNHFPPSCNFLFFFFVHLFSTGVLQSWLLQCITKFERCQRKAFLDSRVDKYPIFSHCRMYSLEMFFFVCLFKCWIRHCDHKFMQLLAYLCSFNISLSSECLMVMPHYPDHCVL